MQDNSSTNNSDREWKGIEILGAKYIISTSTVHNGWKISLTNLIEIWTETITEDIALERCESLNILLDLDSFNVKETLDVILNDIPKYATEKYLDEIKLEIFIDDVAFKFTLKLAKDSCLQFWNEITVPLCHSSIELKCRHKILLGIIKKKDKEIAEYKLSGAQLTRKNIETLPYNQDIFDNRISIDELESEDCVNVFQSMMDLYSELNKCRKSALSTDQKLLQQRSSNSNHVDPDREQKRENTKAAEAALFNDVNDDELQSRIKAEATSEDSHERNKSTISQAGVIEQYNGAGKRRPCASESKIDLRTKSDTEKRFTINNMTNLPSTSNEHQSKKPKRLKVSPNIYDFIA